ncbi:hypothetical protein [Aeromicrobium sp. JJY06]|uniref:hypothetical protein n=1 Tax=Aeromicrobium sp. JJY06 TaxID=3373478 RepID=UPI00376F4029
MTHHARPVLLAVLGLLAGLMMAPAATASAAPAAEPTISGTVSMEGYAGPDSFPGVSMEQPLVVQAYARVGGRWTKVSETSTVGGGADGLGIRSDGSYTLAFKVAYEDVRLKVRQLRYLEDYGIPYPAAAPDTPAAELQTVFWDGTPGGALTIDEAQPIDLRTGSAVDRNITMRLSEKIRVTSRPRITGVASPGQVLTAQPGTYAPAASSVTYRWALREYDNGEYTYSYPTVATGRTFRVTSAHLGRRLALEVEPSRIGFEAPLVQTADLLVKSRSRFAVKAKPGKRKATVTIAIKAPGVATSRIHGKASIYAKGKRIKTVNVRNGKATFTIAKQKKGKRTYTVRYSGNRIITSSAKSLKIAIR